MTVAVRDLRFHRKLRSLEIPKMSSGHISAEEAAELFWNEGKTMNELDKLLEEIEARAEKATPGRFHDLMYVEQIYWLTKGFAEAAGVLMRVFGKKSEPYAETLINWEVINHQDSKALHENNSEFLSNARTDIHRLIAALRECIVLRDRYRYIAEGMEAKLEQSKFVAGIFECKKCKFQLVSQTIHLKSGNHRSECKAPEMCERLWFMWRVSWSDYCASLSSRLELALRRFRRRSDDS